MFQSITILALMQLVVAVPRDPLNPFGTEYFDVEAEGWVAKTYANKVTHFNDTVPDVLNYTQRFWENKDLAVDGAPVFIYICGEWTCSPPTVE